MGVQFSAGSRVMSVVCLKYMFFVSVYRITSELRYSRSFFEEIRNGSLAVPLPCSSLKPLSTGCAVSAALPVSVTGAEVPVPLSLLYFSPQPQKASAEAASNAISMICVFRNIFYLRILTDSILPIIYFM